MSDECWCEKSGKAKPHESVPGCMPHYAVTIPYAKLRHLEAAESRAIRAEQERDEARAQAKERGQYAIKLAAKLATAEDERDSLRARLAKADPLTTSTVAQQEERPDKNCITLPNGDCVGRNCMHDAPAPTAAPRADCVARALEEVAEAWERAGPFGKRLRERAAELQKGDGGR